MKSIEIILKLYNPIESMEVQVNGILLYYKKKHYIVTVHQGLPVTSILIDGKEYSDFIHCMWNDLLIITMNEINLDNVFVFKQFVKTQIDARLDARLDDMNINFIENEFLPINMIPLNPALLYWKMSTKRTSPEGSAGKPIITKNNKLVGIIGKTEDSTIYCIPVFYILCSIDKSDNSKIYTIDCNYDTVNKIDNNKIINNKIYNRSLKIWIPIDCHCAILGDSGKNINISTKAGIIKRLSYIPYINRFIQNNNKITINANKININSCFLHLLKLIDFKLVVSIMENFESRNNLSSEINEINYTLLFI